MLKAIETRYNGYRFRSRLEARWGIFFDTLGVEYLYEHEGFDLGELGYYLPDFYIPKWDCFAEVKPQQFTEEEFNKCLKLPIECLLLDVGTPLVNYGYYCVGQYTGNSYKNYLKIEEFMRVILGPSADKGRLWFLLGESPDDYYLNYDPEIAAKEARFEHGETP